MSIINLEHVKRQEFNTDWSGGARWAFFAIFVVMIIIVLLGTFRVNKRRMQRGSQPLPGTSWMTPPSYRQSQNQYDQPDHVRDPDLPSAYVPQYTETANEYDMGYYDPQGVFHPNPNAKSPIPHPPEVHQRTGNAFVGTGASPLQSNLPSQIPTNANQEGDRVDDESIGDMLRPPAGPPPLSTTASGLNPNSNNNTSEVNYHTVETFTPPAGPPPGRTFNS
ncbi:uncharacterized protein J8A68_003339 [[Candida] subhashii]|uniref:Protein RCR2 n=1 Tax=[Candida] subhashii TaxID=561895 RepID=A0A8J5QMB8_9ASCO|nr:uncharacterized protein J8A68_003339 [[Candida] subhashii]KAG7663161.1 hypothetical protein J8A68_003339 [[Candida] subhashii]